MDGMDGMDLLDFTLAGMIRKGDSPFSTFDFSHLTFNF